MSRVGGGGGFLPDLRQTMNVALEAIRQSGVLFSE